MSVEERVAKVICEQLDVDPKVLHAETNLEKDLGMDSLDAVEMVMKLEEEFDIMINDEEAEKLTTFGVLVAFITEKHAA